MTGQPIPPRLISVRFCRVGQGKGTPGLRVELVDRRDQRVIASFDDLKLAHDWLRQRRYGYSPVNGGVWVRDADHDPSAP